MVKPIISQIRRHWREGALVLILALIIWLALFYARVGAWPYTDPKGSLLSAQVFLQTGSFDLSPYRDSLKDLGWQLEQVDDALFYAYPYGTTLLHLPAVWIANKLGFDMLNPNAEADLNRFLAALSVIFTFLLTWILSRRYNPVSITLFLSLALVLGTSVCSTMGLALWNLNYSVVFALAVLLLLLSDGAMQKPDTGWLIGLLLFAGFMVRPSFALFILMTFAWLGWKHFHQLLRASLLSAILLGLFVVFSLNTFGKPWPGHYQMTDFGALGDLFVNMAGHLVSPSRGVFVFSPFLLLLLPAAWRFRTRWREISLLGFVAAWMLAILLFLSSWFMWWGGGGFGNRLLTELMPGWIALGVVFLGDLLRDPKPLGRLLGRLSFFSLSLFSVWVHLVQGANNPFTASWHHHPNKDTHPEFFWNPRFPQMFASKDQLDRMDAWQAEFVERNYGILIASYRVDDPVVRFGGWYPVEGPGDNPFRWTMSVQPWISLPGQEAATNGTKRLTVALNAGTYLGQEIRVRVNGQPGDTIRTTNKSPAKTYYLGPFKLDRSDSIEILFDVTNPRIPAIEEPGKSKDSRPLGLSLHGIDIYSLE